TAYVSLEPCCHWGRTPPCVDALVEARVQRVVVALEDPDPRVAGAGLRRLREAGLAVETGLCATEAAEVNAGFFSRLALGRPPVRIVIDRHLRVPETARIIAGARDVPTWVLVLRSADPTRRAAFLERGVTLIDVDADAEGQVNLAAALAALGERGITRLLVE